MLTINGVKVTDELQGTVFACVDMGRHRVQTPQSAASVPCVQGLHKPPAYRTHPRRRAARSGGAGLGLGLAQEGQG